MDVRTTRFGIVEVGAERVISFNNGLLGFPEHKTFCLLQPGDDACFFWLQSIDDPDLAFVVTDPAFFVSDYSVPIKPEHAEAMGIKKIEDAQVFVIVNKVGDELTGNLQGPLVIDTVAKKGEQMVLADKRWTTRHPLIRIGAEEPARATA